MGEAFGAFLDDAPRWLTVRHSVGPDQVTAVYGDMLEGRASPDTGHVLSLSPNAFDD